MLTGTKNYQGIRSGESDPAVIRLTDQSRLPFFFETKYCNQGTVLYGFDVNPAGLTVKLTSLREHSQVTGKGNQKMFSDKIK